MNLFKVLHDKVKKSLLQETKLSEDERRLFQWQFLSKIGNVNYLVGKGGANTMFYRVGDVGDPSYCYPEEILAIIKSWSKSEYSAYTIDVDVMGTCVAGPFVKLEEAKDFIPDNSKRPYYIIGHKTDGSSEKVFILKKSLQGLSWVKYDAGLETAPTKRVRKRKLVKSTSAKPRRTRKHR